MILSFRFYYSIPITHFEWWIHDSICVPFSRALCKKWGVLFFTLYFLQLKMAKSICDRVAWLLVAQSPVKGYVCVECAYESRYAGLLLPILSTFYNSRLNLSHWPVGYKWLTLYMLAIAKMPTEKDVAAQYLYLFESFLHKKIIAIRANPYTKARDKCRRQWMNSLGKTTAHCLA